MDDHDLSDCEDLWPRQLGILKRKGQEFPKFETYRENIDGKYWFPTYTYADDVLNFRTGPQRIKVIVQYKDYKKFGSDTNIKFGDNLRGLSRQLLQTQANPPKHAPVNPISPGAIHPPEDAF